ncbi:MAG TPA: multicopper oxidase domain-containing protein [Solirubrobacteraceae bacterium]|nr:multicopper oxidase domain-containing protein [Solirubrobacteraceae bacterium]
MPRGPEERDERAVLGRRGFLAASAGAFLCTIGGERVQLARPGDAAKADAAAARVRRPRTARAAAAAPGAGPTEAMTFATPAPQPGGTVREYWIAARDARWDVIPSRPRRDQWHGRPLRGPSAFRAFVYQEYTPGFAAPRGAPSIPGPLLTGEVGDVIRVHFRNGLSSRYPQALTMHPHGVRYNPEYDGVYLGDFTRAGGFVAPGEEFTYTWECTPDSVGAWPYHDHGPNHTLNTFRGLFGALVVRRRGERPPDVEVPLFLHALQPPVTGLRVQFQCINGRAYAGNTPTIAARVGQDVALHVFGMDSNFHDFHIHGHRWRDAAGQFVDTPTVGPNETTTVRFVEDNPGRWLYHCHVFSHQDAGMAGWYLVTP